jgi:ABC-type uncharacterized transport system substrate-binding protein
MRAGRRSAAAVITLLVLLGQAAPAAAHPHVWVTDVTTFVFEGRQLVGLRHHWTFDEFFGSYVIEQHDVDGDGRFDPAETAALRQGAFETSRSSATSPICGPTATPGRCARSRGLPRASRTAR